jgi:hypothetical protein
VRSYKTKEDYVALKTAIQRTWPDSRLESVTEQDLTKLTEQHPALPTHYLDFLRHIGWGSLGDAVFMFYSGPVHPEDIYGPGNAERLEDVLLIGDNFSEWQLGFDTSSSWKLVEICSESREALDTKLRTVGEFVERLIALGT